MQKRKSCDFGRSMIEMLGVLAIVGVLSVGGIAGYSKAMEKFKINKTIEQYNYLIFGMLNYKKDIPKIPKDTKLISLLNIAEATGLIPNTWKHWNSGGIRDDLGNSLQTYATYDGRMVIGFEPSNYNKKSITHKLCTELFNNILIPLSEPIGFVFIGNGETTYATYYGKTRCSSSTKCLIDVTLSDIKGACDFCADSERCGIYLNFY